jgi:hypothetical protein
VVAGERPRDHGPAICNCFPEVRRSALDALIGLPPLHKNQQLKPRYMHYPQVFFFVLADTFLGVRVDAPTCFSCSYRLGRNLLFEPTAESLFLIVAL